MLAAVMAAIVSACIAYCSGRHSTARGCLKASSDTTSVKTMSDSKIVVWKIEVCSVAMVGRFFGGYLINDWGTGLIQR